jgi:Transcriptional regulators
MATTLTDIAIACGVSKATVSRVLNNDSDFSVSPQTRNEILSAAIAMNYDMEKQLRSKKKQNLPPLAERPKQASFKIGILSHDLTDKTTGDDYYNQIFSNIISTLNNPSLPYHFEFRHSFRDSYEDLDGLDGLIVLGKLCLNPFHPIMSSIKYKLAVDYKAPGNVFDSVRVDFQEAVDIVISYFHSLGLFDIGFVGSYDYITDFNTGKREKRTECRQEAFINYCLHNNIDPQKKIWITDSFASQDGYRITDAMIREGRFPPAILYAADDLALGAYKAFQEHRIEIGKDVSIIGIDDLYFTSFLSPPLTTVSLNIPLIGVTAAHTLLSQLQGRAYPLTIHTPIRLVERKSCRAI